MKRFLSIALIMLAIFSLSACQNPENEYKYDYITYDYPKDSISFKLSGKPISGGAIFECYAHNLFETGNHNSNNPVTPLRCIFDEASKTVFPLCFNASCSHDDTECFAYYFYGQYPSECYGIYEDQVFVIGNLTEKPHEVYAYYYSIDGALQEKVIWDMSFLTTPEGDSVVNPSISHSAACIGSKLYFDVNDANDTHTYSATPKNPDAKITHWTISYDLETKEFSYVSTYTLPYTATGYLHYSDVDGTRLGFSYDGVGYIIDTETGESTATDFTGIIDRLTANGTLPKGVNTFNSIYPLSNIAEIQHSGENSISSFYCDLKTETLIEPSPSQTAKSYGYTFSSFVYQNDLYVNLDRTEDMTNEFFNLSSEEIVYVSLVFGENNSLYNHITETENGLIFSYLKLLEDGSLEPQTVTKIEYGQEVVYRLPDKYVYVTKEDFLDGKIDSPLYYDPETGAFSE